MIEACLKRKIVYKFLKKYEQKKWDIIIPSLLEIAILHIYNSFKKDFYSEVDLFEIIRDLKNKKNLNTKKQDKMQKFKLENNLDICDFFIRKRNTHRSFSKKAKNINELNIYTNYNIDNKIIHYYNKSSEVTPIKRLINYSAIEGNFRTQRLKLDREIKSENNNVKKTKNNKNIQKNNTINYNTIDISNTYKDENTYFSNNNSIYQENNNTEKEYIKVNKIEAFKKIKSNRFSVEDLNNNFLNYKYMTEERNCNRDEINKNSKMEKINNLKQVDLFLSNYNKGSSNREKEIKSSNPKNLFIKRPKNLYCKTVNNSLGNISNRKETGFNTDIRTKMIKNFCNKINIKKVTMREIRKKQFSNIKRSIFAEEIIDHDNNQLINDDIRNDNMENVDDININSIQNNNSNTSKIKINLDKYKKKKSKIINYNIFNNDKTAKNKTFINAPDFFINTINYNKRNFKKI